MKPINCIKLYRAKSGWRWRIENTRMRIIAASTEAYRRRKDAHANLQRVTGEQLEISRGFRGPSVSWCVRARA